MSVHHGPQFAKLPLRASGVTEAPAPGWFEGIVAAALAVGVAASLVEWQGIHYAQWLVWSAASVVTGDVAAARAKWKDRMIGAIVGVPAGMLVGIFMPHAPVFFDVLTAAIVLTLVAFNRYVVAFGTGSMVMFSVFYVILLVAFFHFARRWLRNGPDLTLTPADTSTKREALHAIDY